jgi:hypothetical protein
VFPATGETVGDDEDAEPGRGERGTDPDRRREAEAGRERMPPSQSPTALPTFARSGAEAVFVRGLLDTNGAQVVKDLRAAMDADLLATDLLAPVPMLVAQAGAAARGGYITATGLIPDRLPPAGARFIDRFGRTHGPGRRPRMPVEKTVVYAAQAAPVLLDAIARSDGTRGSVIDQLSARALATACSARSASTPTATSTQAPSPCYASAAADGQGRS